MKSGFLQDVLGNNSSTRLMAFIVLFVVIVFSGFILWVGKGAIGEAADKVVQLWTLVFIPLLGLLGVNKWIETKSIQNDSNNTNSPSVN